MDDPFIQLLSKCPNSTTLIPNRDIDYVLTYGINAKAMTTLAPNIPLTLDHLGILLDLDLEEFFHQTTLASPLQPLVS
jgi:hypothetical protein